MKKYIFNRVTGVMESVDPVDLHSVNQNSQVSSDSENYKSIVQKREEKAQDIDPNEDIVQFRVKRDYTLLEITDKDTGKTLGYIGGYALDFDFNTKEVNSTAKIEQFLNGIKSLFRNVITEKLLKNQ